MTVHTVTAFFDDRKHADEAVGLLRRAGLSDPAVTLSPSDAREEFATFDPLGTGTPKHKGFWGMLEDLFGGSDDHERYAEGVRRGGTMLTARVDDDQLDEAVEILDRYGSIDLAERAVSWRNDGWLGNSAGMPSEAALVPDALGAGILGAPTMMPPPLEPAPIVTPASFAVSSPVEAPVSLQVGASTTVEHVSDSVPAAADRRDRDILQVVEEHLVVGKRSVSRGKVRVHSHVVARPVAEEIRLRDETIRVDRQAVDRALSMDELEGAGFQNRTLEMEEVDEEAVVSKTARIVEEIGFRKDVSARTETIRDTVRSTKVEIDDSRPMVGADDVAPAAPSAVAGLPNKPV